MVILAHLDYEWGHHTSFTTSPPHLNSTAAPEREPSAYPTPELIAYPITVCIYFILSLYAKLRVVCPFVGAFILWFIYYY